MRLLSSVQGRAVRRPTRASTARLGHSNREKARSIAGNLIQTESFRDVIDLYRDGQLTVATRIDRDSLAWADKSDSRIHPLAFVEFVTNTLTFYRLVLADMRITPVALHLEVCLGNLIRNGEGTSLPAGAINNRGWTLVQTRSSSSVVADDHGRRIQLRPGTSLLSHPA